MATFHIVLKKECQPNAHTVDALLEDFRVQYGLRNPNRQRAINLGIVTGELTEDAVVLLVRDNRVLAVDSDKLRYTQS